MTTAKTMTDQMLCQICSSRPAEVVISRRRLGDADRTLACPECAAERTRLYAGQGVDLGGMLSRLDAGPSGHKVSSSACRLCGTTIADLITSGRPGCCLCYGRFSGEMDEAIRVAQGRSRHTGKAPRR